MISDRITGGLTTVLGLMAVVGASRLPPMPGQQIGPSVFPAVVGSALIACGLLIAFGVGRSLESNEVVEGEVEARPLWRAFVPVALLLFYAATIKFLGFLIVAFVMVAALSLIMGARPVHAIALGLVASPAIHLLFGKLLRVPLAPGLLPAPW